LACLLLLQRPDLLHRLDHKLGCGLSQTTVNNNSGLRCASLLVWCAGGYFQTSGTDASVLLRLKEDYDGAEPAASSVAAINLMRLAALLPNGGKHSDVVLLWQQQQQQQQSGQWQQQWQDCGADSLLHVADVCMMLFQAG
jgi:hypothetical protein